MSPDNASHPHSRLVALDWLRTGTIVYVVLFHATQVAPFSGVDRAVRDMHWCLNALITATGLWRMPLMFLIAGASTAYMLGRRSSRAFAAARARRLVVPALFTFLVAVPLLRYADRYSHEAPLAFASHAWPSLFDHGVPQWYNLWFVVYLVICTAVLLVVRAAVRAARGAFPAAARATVPTAAALAACAGALTLAAAVPTRLMLLIQVVPGIDPRGLVASAAMFAAGVVVARDHRAVPMILRGRRGALALAAAFGALVGTFEAAAALELAVLPSVVSHGRSVGADEWARRVASAGGAWFGALAVLGYGLAYLRRSSGVLEYMRDASYVVYLIHLPILAWVARALDGLQPLNVVQEYALLVTLTGALTLALYESAIRRTRLGRALFGLPERVAIDGPRTAGARAGSPAVERRIGAVGVATTAAR